MKHIRKLLHYVNPYWKRSLVSLALLISVVFMDLSIPRLIQEIIDEGINANNIKVVTSTTLLMLGISVIQTFFAIGNNILSVQVGESVARDLREAIFNKIQSFSFGNLDHINTGQLMVRLSSDTAVFQRLVQVSLRIGTRAPLLMIGSMILMFNTDNRLALMMVPLLIIISIIIVFFMSKMGPLFNTVQQKLDRLNIVLQENISGVRLVKAFVRAEHEGKRFEASNEGYTRHSIKVMQFMATLSPSMSILVNAGIVAVIWIGGIQSINASITIGQLVAFVNYLQTTMGPLTIVVMLANVVAAGTASAKRINEVLETIPEIQGPQDPVPNIDLSNPRIEFENVSFYYNGTSIGEVLKGINLIIEPGKTIAILGSTGAGKSSLVNLIPRFYEVTTGRITINGLDIKKIPQSQLANQIGIVPQETILFTGSVADNIRYGRPDACLEDVVESAKTAQAHEFILKLPRGYATHIEERGVNLSGGQKQRIAIARALLKDPSILILDDSTSSVDVATETKIQNSLKKSGHKRTTFIVAQRISTVLKADKIVVIDEGSIKAEGTHEQLMQTSSVYQEIYDSQLGNGFYINRTI